MKPSIHHIALIASSRRTVEFYEQLGFSVERVILREAKGDTVVLMSSDGGWLEIFIDPSHPPRPEGKEPLGIRHFALSVDDLDSAAARFGGQPVGRDWAGVRYTVIRDPDGVAVELREAKPVPEVPKRPGEPKNS